MNDVDVPAVEVSDLNAPSGESSADVGARVLAEREIPSMSLQSTDTPEPEFWALTLASSFEDWLS